MRPGLIDYRTEYSDRLREEGQLKEARKFLLKAAVRRGFVLTGDQRSRVAECSDLETLELWADRAWDASSPEKIFE